MRFFENLPDPDAYYEPSSFNGPLEDGSFIEPPLSLEGPDTHEDMAPVFENHLSAIHENGKDK